MTLGEYLRLAGGRRWEWGAWDCCAFPAGWVMECGHPDPMALWRGRYASEAQAQGLIDEAGGLADLWAIGLGALPEPDAPIAGDVAVCLVGSAGGLAENGGIFTGERWAFLGSRGLICSSVDPGRIVRVWRP